MCVAWGNSLSFGRTPLVNGFLNGLTELKTVLVP